MHLSVWKTIISTRFISKEWLCMLLCNKLATSICHLQALPTTYCQGYSLWDYISSWCLQHSLRSHPTSDFRGTVIENFYWVFTQLTFSCTILPFFSLTQSHTDVSAFIKQLPSVTWEFELHRHFMCSWDTSGYWSDKIHLSTL